MSGLRKAYLKLGDERRGEDLIRTYTRVGWSELKKGDVVVLYEPNGEPVEDGAEHHLIEDPWFEPDLHLYVIKTADPVRVIHKETADEVVKQGRAATVFGANPKGVPIVPRTLDCGDAGEVSGVFEQTDLASKARGDE